MRTRHSFGGKGSNEDPLGATSASKQFGIGMCLIYLFLLLT